MKKQLGNVYNLQLDVFPIYFIENLVLKCLLKKLCISIYDMF